MVHTVKFDVPVLSPVWGRDGYWRLERDWTISVGSRTFVVKRGFVTDGASIPRILTPICGDRFSRPRLYAAIVHDWIYSGRVPGLTRKDADYIYRDILLYLGFGRIRTWAEWSVIRIFGGSRWKARNGKMKKCLFLAAVGALALVGCTVTKAEWGGEEPIVDKDGNPVIAQDGTVQKIKQPTKLYNNRHWMDTQVASGNFSVTKDGDINVSINDYKSVTSTNLANLVDTSLSGVALLAEKVGAAIATGGGSVAADSTQAAIAALVAKFVSAGGKADKATVSAENGSVTISDGAITCTDGNCYAQ